MQKGVEQMVKSLVALSLQEFSFEDVVPPENDIRYSSTEHELIRNVCLDWHVCVTILED
jgi:hypothetical protein